MYDITIASNILKEYEELSDIATLMTEEEVKEFMEYEYAGGEK